MQRPASWWPWLSLGTIYVIWGSTYLAIRIVVREMPPFAAASLRFMVAGLVLLVLSSWRAGERRLPTGRQWRDYGIAGALLLGGGNAGVMWSETRVSSGVAALLVATVPLWIALLDRFRKGGQRWSASLWVGIGLGLLGVAAVARPSSSGGEWAGIVVLQAGALSWTLGVLQAQSIASRLPPLSAAAVEMITGSVVLFLTSCVAREPRAHLFTASAAAWSALAYLTIFGSLVAFTAFAYCLNHLPASIVSTYAYVNPVMAVVLGRIFLKEPLPGSLVAGAALIVAAVVLTTRSIRPEPRRAGADAGPSGPPHAEPPEA